MDPICSECLRFTFPPIEISSAAPEFDRCVRGHLERTGGLISKLYNAQLGEFHSSALSTNYFPYKLLQH